PRFDMTEFKKPSLRGLADEVVCALGHGNLYLNRKSGEIAGIPHAFMTDLCLSESDKRSEWQAELARTIEEIETTDDWIALPGSHDIDEWEIMRAFADSLDDSDRSDEFREAIVGRRAFRRFKSKLDKFR